MTKPKIEKELADYLIEAIKEDYLLCLIVTSYTQGKLKSKNLPFGIGKTTIGGWLNYYLNGEDWEKVFESFVYNPYDLAVLLEPSRIRLNAALWDDVQRTAPATQGVPRAIRNLANFLSTERPEIACLIMTAPNINSIAAPLRKLVVFEVIVVERGRYEVQKISYHKTFKKPLKDSAQLEYLEEIAQEAPFPPLPPDIEKRYRLWRIEEKLKLYPQLLTELKTYCDLQKWTGTKDDLPLFATEIIRAGHGYALKVPDEIGRELHRKNVQAILSTLE